jgi:hypothetical protein
MSDTTSKIRILFDGSAAGVVAASAVAKRAIASVNDESGKLSKAADKTGSGLLTVAKGFAAVGAVGGAVQVIGGVAGALTQLAPAALLLPGALLGGAAAMGTFKIATAGMGDALKAGLSGDMAKFAEATKGMAPEMQAAAKAVTAFKPQIDALKKAVQGNFWGEFSGEITRVGKTLLPILHDGLGTIAQDMGGVAFAALQATRTPFFTGALTSILSDTAGFFRELGTAAGDVLTGIVGIGKVGAQYLPALGEGIGGVAKRFKDWVTSLQGQNQIKVWIDGAIAGFRDLFAIVGNVGSILGSVFTGLGGQLSSPLASIRALTGEVATFLKTVEAQDGLRALGETLRVVGEQVGRVVLTAFRELAPTLVAIGPVAQEVARTFGDLLVNAIQTLGPIIRGVASVLGEFPGVVSLATTAVVGFVVAMKTIKNIQSGQSLFGAFLGSIKRGLAEKLPPLTLQREHGAGAGATRRVHRRGEQERADGEHQRQHRTVPRSPCGRSSPRSPQGKGEVIIDGQPMKAQDALSFVIGLINNSNPEVQINGNQREGRGRPRRVPTEGEQVRSNGAR